MSFIAIVLVLGISATYAAFTSTPVTIANNTLATGTAELKLCNSAGDGWKTTITPSMTLNNLVPGDTDEELTLGQDLYVGNDSGTLDNNNDTTNCNTYAPGVTPGSSDVTMTLLPTFVAAPVCSAPGLENDLSLNIKVGAEESGNIPLADWFTNTTTVGSLTPDQHAEVTVFASLSSDAEDQGATCTFDIQFVGTSESGPGGDPGGLVEG